MTVRPIIFVYAYNSMALQKGKIKWFNSHFNFWRASEKPESLKLGEIIVDCKPE